MIVRGYIDYDCLECERVDQDFTLLEYYCDRHKWMPAMVDGKATAIKRGPRTHEIEEEE